MEFTRRETLVIGAATAAVAALPMPAMASATDDLIAEFTGGADVADSGVDLDAPEIAENGNTVPIEVGAEGAVSIMVLAAGNPTPPVATFNFGPLAGASRAKTRIRLATTQDVIAVAKMADGSFAKSTKTVKVTIGGCGG
ncbi:thiosulfate oxidation carrier protein SoxY [Roseovarius indicus]|uniref:Sulfur oxidation protein SoxY n=1 Tax=Roseovarius indicus TaxID=540747 RepID=A0A0T5PDM8_9RHOB|nr:thiosulfate oxidation carrier protein SoxY [Roseovarius indicus]KRS19264.1 sulfur oxidation protein SoxY [Roseovarius indicus]OAO07388.1 thiosulfate oxidation carrier protein SoxY [Roseovarius indicus]QEW26005.1 sulfur oxidation protein SoxY [Roseovarius indicus]SFD91743.1 sulfur-oxidizing protein SoxY [Roseovarius indicus]